MEKKFWRASCNILKDMTWFRKNELKFCGPKLK